MWKSTTSAAARAAHLQFSLQLKLGSSSYSTMLLRFRMPALFVTPSSWSSTPPFTPALSCAPALTSGSALAESAEGSSSSWSLGSLWDGILLAVPKKKVSHSRKSMRSANKGLKDRVDLVHCSACGKPKLHHHICAYCYYDLNRARKLALKGEQKSLNLD